VFPARCRSRVSDAIGGSARLTKHELRNPTCEIECLQETRILFCIFKSYVVGIYVSLRKVLDVYKPARSKVPPFHTVHRAAASPPPLLSPDFWLSLESSVLATSPPHIPNSSLYKILALLIRSLTRVLSMPHSFPLYLYTSMFIAP
jgi:hypothetical protein